MDRTLDELAHLGRAVHEGAAVDGQWLDRVSARAYHVSLAELDMEG
jgi:hypothetical protein